MFQAFISSQRNSKIREKCLHKSKYKFVDAPDTKMGRRIRMKQILYLTGRFEYYGALLKPSVLA